jgi:hypothetical protein
VRVVLATHAVACDDAGLMQTLLANADILTSARMAAGMTSRARRPEAPELAG